MKYLIVFILLIFLSLSANALSKAEIIEEAIKCCKSQLSINRKDGIGLMLLHYLSTETTSNRDVILLKAKIKRGLDIKADGKGDLIALNKLFLKASVIYIKAKNYKKAAYYLKMAETLNPLSDEALINQHILIEKGFKITSEQLLGNNKIIIPKTPKPNKPKQTIAKLPKNAITFKIADHRYALILEKTTWKEAKEKAGSLGGYLVCITSKDENDVILKVVKNREVWIGGTDEIKEGSFKWVSGEQFSYSNFEVGEPNNHNGGEHYLTFRTGFWNDNRIDKYSGGFIVEWDK